MMGQNAKLFGDEVCLPKPSLEARADALGLAHRPPSDQDSRPKRPPETSKAGERLYA